MTGACEIQSEFSVQNPRPLANKRLFFVKNLIMNNKVINRVLQI